MWRRRSKRQRAGFEAEELNLLPLMSLFVALVPTLLYSAVFLPVSAIELEFPGAGGVAQESSAPVTVRVAAGSLQLEGVPGQAFPALDRRDPAARAALASQLQAARARLPEARGALLICAHDVPYRDVVEIMDLVREAGLGNCTLLGAAS